MKKQAIMIMYHTDYYLLQKLLKLLDYKYFDIYLHVDKKVKNFDFEGTKKLLKYSNLYYTKRLNVKWSTYSQIKCELLLLKTATQRNYSYYHLISGVDLPIKKCDEIYNFFNKRYPKEFIAFTDKNKVSNSNLERIKYYHFLNCNRRNPNKIIRKISNTIYYRSLTFQKKININRLKKYGTINFQKGANWFSITDDFARYVLNKSKEFKKIFYYSNCADELFLQTIIVNSEFKKNIYCDNKKEEDGILRHIDWERGEPYIFRESDYEELINSNSMFARKFSSSVDEEIINKIYDKFKNK